MSIFAKKPEPEPRATAQTATTGPSSATPPATGGSRGGYGIADVIQLMRTLPVDQNPELVVRVVRATLSSLNVHLPEIIEDASKKQKTTQDRITAVHGQIADLEKQLDAHRKEIASLEADLKETTGVKERLQMADKPGFGGASNPFSSRTETPTSTPLGQTLNPPLSGTR